MSQLGNQVTAAPGAQQPIFEEAERFAITRKLMVKDSPTGGRWGYELWSGMSQQRVVECSRRCRRS